MLIDITGLSPKLNSQVGGRIDCNSVPGHVEMFKCATIPGAAIAAILILMPPVLADHLDHDSDVNEPFSVIGPLDDKDLPSQAKKGTGRQLRSHGSRGFTSSKWSIDLPNRGKITVRRKQQKVTGDGRGVTWIGQVEGAEGGLVSITQRDDLISGFIDDGTRYWTIENAGDGLYKLYEIDVSQTPPPAAPVAPDGTSTGGSTQSGSIQGDSGTVIQDVLIAYTPEVVDRYGGIAATETAITNHVAAVNQAYSNSQVNIQMNLVGTVALSQPQSGDITTTLYRLQSPSDGYYDEVHGLRDQLGADLVAMLTTETGYCGIAFLNHPQTPGENNWAFSVISAYNGYTCLPLTLGHEIGHNQGLCHNREETSCTNPAYPYGYGYRVCGGTGFRTVMSYVCSGSVRVYHFSNPNVTYNGMPTGISYDTDPNNSSEAWRALNDSAADVAAWRDFCSLIAEPAAPTNLTATAAASSQVNLSWVDEADDESAFQVERSPDGISGWIKIATVGANNGTGGSLSYMDEGLESATSYSYRVRAINCAGNSGYAGPASATTEAPPAAPPSVPEGVAAVADTPDFVEVSWDSASGAAVYEIGRSVKLKRGHKWSAVGDPIASVSAPIIFFDDSSASPGETYRYYVRARNSSGASDWSSPAEISILDGTSSGGSKNCKGKKSTCGSS